MSIVYNIERRIGRQNDRRPKVCSAASAAINPHPVARFAGTMKIRKFDQTIAVCQLPDRFPVPDWCRGEFSAAIYSPGELTLICDQRNIPEDFESGARAKIKRDWICFGIDQILDFEIVGVIADLSRVLASAKIPIFVISSYNTDYLLVPDRFCEQATDALVRAGYEIHH